MAGNNPRMMNDRRYMPREELDGILDAAGLSGTVYLERGWSLSLTDGDDDPFAITVGACPPIGMTNPGTLRDLTLTALVAANRPTGASVIVDLRKNGVTVLSTPLVLPVATVSVSTTSFTDDAFVAGDVFRLHRTQVGSTFGGSDIDARMGLDLEVA